MPGEGLPPAHDPDAEIVLGSAGILKRPRVPIPAGIAPDPDFSPGETFRLWREAS